MFATVAARDGVEFGRYTVHFTYRYPPLRLALGLATGGGVVTPGVTRNENSVFP